MATIKASLISEVQVRPYTSTKVWVAVCLKNGRTLQATKTDAEWGVMWEALKRNGFAIAVVDQGLSRYTR